MKRIIPVLFFGLAVFAAAQETSAGLFRQEGIASWYGPEFDGQPTASGEIFNSALLTAAHPALPFGTMVTVTNKQNNRTVTVRINDRGPFVSARIIDVSKAAAEQLDMIATGTAPVLVESRNSAAAKPQVQAAPVQVLPEDPPPETQAALPAVTAYKQPVPEPDVPAASSVPTASSVPAAPAAPPAPAASSAPSVPAVPSGVQNIRTPLAVRLIPAISPEKNKVYRLQVGSYKIPKNAMDAFEKLKSAGLNPAYERNGDFYRVVLAGIRADDINSTTEKIGLAGFSEALIREER
jgi:rare lipoprotein A